MRAEILLVEFPDRGNLEQMRRNKRAMLTSPRELRTMSQVSECLEARGMRLEARSRRVIYDGADVGGELAGVPHAQLIHCTLDQIEDRLSHVLLQVQHAQGRTALAGRVERRLHDIVDHLFRERRG